MIYTSGTRLCSTRRILSSATSAPPLHSVFAAHSFSASDVAPVNSFPRSTTNVSNSTWVFDLSATDWDAWIGDEAARQLAENSGCYSVVHPGTNLKIISLNTQYWYKANCTSRSRQPCRRADVFVAVWLYDSDRPQWNPNSVLSWMAEELHSAETAGQKAWISTSSPSLLRANLTPRVDSRAYAIRKARRTCRPVQLRRSDLPALSRHDHEFRFWSFSPRRNRDWLLRLQQSNGRDGESPLIHGRCCHSAKYVPFFSPATLLISSAGGNPVFRVYDVDPDSYEVMDFTTYYTNVSLPSFGVEPVWEPYYSARSYGALLDPPLRDDESLSPGFWHRVTELMETDE